MEPVLRVLLYVVLIGLSGTGIWAVVEIANAARSARVLTDDLDARVPPLLDKAGRTLDNVNTEIVKVDDIVTQIEEVSDRVGATTRTAQEIVGAPVAAVMGLGDRVRRVVSVLVGRRM